MSNELRQGTDFKTLIKYLKKKVPRLGEVVFDLGFFSIDELVNFALKNKRVSSYIEAEKLVLEFIIRSLGFEVISEGIQDMRNQIEAIYRARETIIAALRKNRLKTDTYSKPIA